MSDLLLLIDWDKVLDDAIAESTCPGLQLETVDWGKVLDDAIAESAQAFQQLESVNWQKSFDEKNKDTNAII